MSALLHQLLPSTLLKAVHWAPHLSSSEMLTRVDEPLTNELEVAITRHLFEVIALHEQPIL